MWTLEQVISLPDGTAFVEGDAVVSGSTVMIGDVAAVTVQDNSSAGTLTAQLADNALHLVYQKSLENWQALTEESISNLDLAVTLHQEAIVCAQEFEQGAVDVQATFTAIPVTAEKETPAVYSATLNEDEEDVITRQGHLLLPLNGEGGEDGEQTRANANIEVTYTGEPIYVESSGKKQLAVCYTITITNLNQAPSGEPAQDEGSVSLRVVQDLTEKLFSDEKPTEEATEDPNATAGGWSDGSLTWENVQIPAGKSWSKKVTVLVDSQEITNYETLPEALESTLMVYEADLQDQDPIKTVKETVDLKTFVGETIIPQDNQQLSKTVYWQDNNDASLRPGADWFGKNVGLEFCIVPVGKTEPPEDAQWYDGAKATELLGMQQAPQVDAVAEGNTFKLTADLPSKIQYGQSGEKSLQYQVFWRMTPPQSGVDHYWFVENPAQYDPTDPDGWYYLLRQELEFVIDLRDQYHLESKEDAKIKNFLEETFREHFALTYLAGSTEQATLKLSDDRLSWSIEKEDGVWKLKVEKTVHFDVHGDGVHYTLKDDTHPVNAELDGVSDTKGDTFKLEYNNTAVPNGANDTDKAHAGGTIILTRQGEVDYTATKVWLDPAGAQEEQRPEGYFELWRYTQKGEDSSFQQASTVAGQADTPLKTNEDTQQVEYNNLPKYDPDGNRYVYGVKEIITEEESETIGNYEQVFGRVDGEDQVTDTAPPTQDPDTWVRDSQDLMVYNGGTITNRREGGRWLSVTKEWDASSFQAGLENVSVELSLYVREKSDTATDDDWEPVLDTNQQQVKLILDQFDTIHSSQTKSLYVPSYNAQGKAVEYWFKETAIFNNGQRIETEPIENGGENEDFSFKLEYNGQQISFIADHPTREQIQNGHGTIINRIQDDITFTIKKVWEGDITPHGVSFDLLQQGQNTDTRYVGTVTLDSPADGEGETGRWQDDKTEITLTVQEAGRSSTDDGVSHPQKKEYEVTYQVTKDDFTELVISNLPRYDEHGYSYEYIIQEKGGNPTSQETTIDKDGNYETTVVNGPGTGYRILVRKRWVDNSDVQHREPVTVAAYYRTGEEPSENDPRLGEIILGGTTDDSQTHKAWYGYMSLSFNETELGEYDANKVYIRELKMGEHEVELQDDGDDLVYTDHHVYDVTYSKENIKADDYVGEELYIVTNRRLGMIDLTVQKNWVDGGALQKALKDAGVTPVLVLDFAPSNSAVVPDNAIDYENGTVTLFLNPVKIQGKDGEPVAAIQPISDSGENYFFNLPKYDAQGRTASYTVDEMWCFNANISSGAIERADCMTTDQLKEELKKKEDESAKALLNLLNDLQYSKVDGEYIEHDESLQSDFQEIEITNRLSGTKVIHFHKIWKDAYAQSQNNRPDIYLDIYVWNGEEMKLQYYNYSWAESESTPSTGDYLTCTVPNLPKYDDQGRELFYYAIERVSIENMADFDYTDPQFQYEETDYTVNYEGESPQLPEQNTMQLDGCTLDVLKVHDGDVSVWEGGTIVNSLKGHVTINGIKIWSALPNATEESDLPPVTFEVYQLETISDNQEQAKKGTLVAELSISDWNAQSNAHISHENGQYKFTISVATKNVESEGLKEGDPLPLYDEDGNRYYYTLIENFAERTLEGDSELDWGDVYTVNQNFHEYSITNTYAPQKGSLAVKKLLQVEKDQKEYPAITMRLYQVAPDAQGQYDNQPSVLYGEQVWSSDEVNTAAEENTLTSPATLSKEFTFTDLPIYAPNGYPYQYFVAEVIENGGYQMNYEAAVVQGNESVIDKVFGDQSASKKVETIDGTTVLRTKAIAVTKNLEDGSAATPAVGATFADKYKGDMLELSGKKVWNDQNNALGHRPSPEDFEKNVKLYRYAKAQTGQNNAIDESEVKLGENQWKWTTSADSNEWSYTITGLERYAPNGMPWIYVVRENLTDMEATEYVPTGQKTNGGNKTGEVNSEKVSPTDGTITMPNLTNSLETSQSFQKNWQNSAGNPIEDDYLGLGELTITGQLWVGTKTNGTPSAMQPASQFFNTTDPWSKWFTGDAAAIKDNDFTVSLKTSLGDNDAKTTINHLPRVDKKGNELVYAIVETEIKNDAGFSQSFTWKFEDGELQVAKADPANGLFTPQSVTPANGTTRAVNQMKTTQLSVSKEWIGDTNETNLRPSSIDVVVERKATAAGNQNDLQELNRATFMSSRTLGDGWEIVPDGSESLVFTLNNANGWKATATNLPSHGIEEGELVVYTYRFRELKPDWNEDNVPSPDEILDAGQRYDDHYTVTAYDDQNHKITNTLTHMEVTAVKYWKPDGLSGQYAEVTFTLQSRTQGAGEGGWADVAGQDEIVLDGTVDQNGEFDAWQARWTDLPRSDAQGNSLEYRVLETLVNGLTEGQQVTIQYPNASISGATADKTYRITNIPLGKITITKEDGKGAGLSGVVFQLTDNNGSTPKQATTAQDGTVTFEQLPLYKADGTPITYTLTESSTPSGYIQLTEPITVSFTAADAPQDGVFWQTANGYLLHEVGYKVVNGQSFAVVYTGGSGFYWPGLAGAGVAAVGVLYLVYRKTRSRNTER